MAAILPGVGCNALADVAPSCHTGIRTVGGAGWQFSDFEILPPWQEKTCQGGVKWKKWDFWQVRKTCQGGVKWKNLRFLTSSENLSRGGKISKFYSRGGGKWNNNSEFYLLKALF